MVLGIGTSVNVGLFGKTPSQPDFVRHNAGSASARAWDEWLNAGLAEMRRVEGDDWTPIFDAAAPLHCIARPSGDPRQVLAGHISPSRDQSGRRYPLTVFCEFQLDRQARGIQVLPYALTSFLDAAAHLAGDGKSPLGTSLGTMSALVPSNPADLSGRMASQLREMTMESFWTAVLGSFDDPRKYLCIKNLFGTLAPLRGYDPQRLAMGLRLPGVARASHLSPSLVMSSWISLCRAVIGEESLANSWLFWHNSPGAARPGCFLFFRTPSPGVLSALLDPGHAVESIWDMEIVGAERIAESRDALGAAISGVLDTPHFAMLDFVQRI